MIPPFIVYDTESQLMSTEVQGGWNNVYNFKMASCVTYDSEINQYQFFTDRDEVCRYFSAKADKPVISFNGIGFDTKLLLGDNRQLVGRNVSSHDNKYGWKEIDIYLEMMACVMGTSSYQDTLTQLKTSRGKFPPGTFKLDTICKNTINSQKNGASEDGPKLFKEGNFAKLFEYNLQDVRLLKDIYMFIKKNRYIINGEYDVVKFP